MGPTAGPSGSARLLGGGRPQRRSSITPSQSAGLTEAALQGVDRPAELRWSRCGRYDARGAVFQADVAGSL